SLTALAVSLPAPLSGHGVTGTDRLALICMHLAAGTVLIPVLALTIRPSRRPADDAVAGPGGPAAGPAKPARGSAQAPGSPCARPFSGGPRQGQSLAPWLLVEPVTTQIIRSMARRSASPRSWVRGVPGWPGRKERTRDRPHPGPRRAARPSRNRPRLGNTPADPQSP